MSIRVSVIVPVFNPGVFLRKCLDSLFAQTLADIEILCVDDNSTDGSSAVLAEYAAKDPRLKVVSLTRTEGAARARNRGIELARGEYLYFCDADDWPRKDLLEKMCAAADAGRADIAISDVHHYDQVTSRIYKIWKPPSTVVFPCSGEELGDDVFSSFLWAVWNKLFRREFIVESNLLFQDIPRNNDIYFVNCAVLLAKRIVRSGSCYYYRHNHGGNVSSMRGKHPYAAFEAWRAIVGKLEEVGMRDACRLAVARGVVDSSINLFRGIGSEWNFVQLQERVKAEVAAFGVDEKLLGPNGPKNPWLEKFRMLNSSPFALLKYIQKKLQGELVGALGREIDVKKKFADAKAQLKETEERAENLRKAGIGLEAKAADCARELADAKVQKEELMQRNAQLIASLDRFGGMAETIARLTSEIESRRSREQELSACLREAQARLKETEERAEHLRKAGIGLEATVADRARELADAKAQKEELVQRNAQLIASLDRFGGMAETIARLTSEIEDRRRHEQELATGLREAQTMLKVVSSRRGALRVLLGRSVLGRPFESGPQMS